MFTLMFILGQVSSGVLTRFLVQVQEVALRARPDIVVATPGRILDHLQNSLSVGLEDLSILVLDEADRLLELGFTQEIHELVSWPDCDCFQEFLLWPCFSGGWFIAFWCLLVSI